MKKIQLILFFLLVVGMLTGCSNYADDYDKNTIVVKGNGSIVEIAVEDFSELSVTSESLQTYIEEQVAAYNEEAGKKLIKNEFLEAEDMSKVKLVLNYKDIESYNSFNLLDYTLEDFSKAEESVLVGTFISADGESVKASEMEGTKKAKVLIMSEATDVVVKGDILYYNEEVSVKDGIATTTGEENAIIIFK